MAESQPSKPDENAAAGVPEELQKILDPIFKTASAGEDPTPMIDQLRQLLLGQSLPAEDVEAFIKDIRVQAEHIRTETVEPTEIPEELKRVLDPIFQAAAAGEDVSPTIDQLREFLLSQSHPAEHVEAFIADVRQQADQVRPPTT